MKIVLTLVFALMCWRVCNKLLTPPHCPFCGSDKVYKVEEDDGGGDYICEDCECIF